MKHLALLLAVAVALCGAANAQITQISAAGFSTPLGILDFDTGAPAPGPVSGTDPYFLAAGLANVSIVNNPGLHTAGSDVLSTNVTGNCLASVGNSLAIVAPSGAMDDHTAGAGWSFQLATPVRQVTFVLTDQVNHPFVVETWTGGVLQSSLNVQHPGSATVWYFEDLAGFDELRLMNAQNNGGWGIDDIGFAAPCPGGVCPPIPAGTWQANSAEASADIDGLPGSGTAPITVVSQVGTLSTININGLAMPYEVIVQVNGPGPVPNLGYLTFEAVNLDPFDPSSFFLFGLNFSPVPLAPASINALAPNGSLSFQMVVIDPAAPEGLSLSAANSLQGVTCQNPQDFETLPTGTGGTYPIGWSNGGGTAEWRVHSGTTTSSATGPLTGAFSGSNYFYCETSSPNTAGTFIFDTCAYDSTTLSFLTLDFFLSRLGATIGTLNIYQDDGAGFGVTPIASYTGAEPGGLDWTAESIPFAPGGPTVKFRFEYTAGGSFTGDLAIDLLSVN